MGAILILIVVSCLIGVLSSIGTHCFNAYECVNQHYVGCCSVLSYGYKSNSGANSSLYQYDFDTNGGHKCYGSFSCSKISFINSSQDIACGGSNACSYVSGSPLDGLRTFCSAPNSCSYSNIKAGYSHCKGDQSCKHTNISGAFRVYIYGAYALYKGTIDSNGAEDHAMIIYISGHYAGYGAKIICQATETCTINCYGNACYMLYIECRGTNNCIVNNLHSNNTNCQPISDIYTFTIALLYTPFNLLYDSALDTQNNDQVCNQENQITYDNYREHDGSSDIISSTAPICCRGMESCSNVNKIEINATNAYNMICSGYQSCQSVARIINNNGDVYCEGQLSCRSTHIMTRNSVYCLGSQSCYRSNISNAQNVFCGGYGGCEFSRIQSNGDLNVYIFGPVHQGETQIFCNNNDNCFVYCSPNACDLTNVYCNGCSSYEIFGNNNDSYYCPEIITAPPTTTNPTTQPITTNPTTYPITRYPTLPTLNPITVQPTTSSPTSMISTSVSVNLGEQDLPKVYRYVCLLVMVVMTFL